MPFDHSTHFARLGYVSGSLLLSAVPGPGVPLTLSGALLCVSPFVAAIPNLTLHQTNLTAGSRKLAQMVNSLWRLGVPLEWQTLTGPGAGSISWDYPVCTSAK